ncbi:MAG TPA: 3-phosphoshikimate 1-carboxyvinyltransferase [Thermomicrobiaceae bacterium]|nr:3-phosphoshikimate 1-carboxyvinyltransferase [Thermomicrobiaceae bacterium]
MSARSPNLPGAIEIVPVRQPVDVDVTLPGSKSYTNRALPLAAMATGRSVLRNALFSDDTEHMATALRALGIDVRQDPLAGTFEVIGGGGTLPARRANLFVGNSGTTARFLTAMLALGRGEFLLDGTAAMRRRPIEPLLDALRQLGVGANSLEGTGCPPVCVRAEGFQGGHARLSGIESSQYLSALLMVGPLSREGIEIEIVGDLVSKPYVEMTFASMAAFGATGEHDRYRLFRVPGGQHYTGTDYTMEPDASAASYFFALGAVTGGRVRIANLGENSRQGDLRFVDALEQMGCTVLRGPNFTEVRGPQRLRGVDVDMQGISDTAPTLAAIAPLAEGPTMIRNVAHMRHKETDRIAALATELRRLGVGVEERADGLEIHPGPVRPATIETYDDHRMAMSFALLGCAVPGVTIANPGCVAKTFPDFFERLARATAVA